MSDYLDTGKAFRLKRHFLKWRADSRNGKLFFFKTLSGFIDHDRVGIKGSDRKQNCGTGQTAAYLGQLLFPVTALDADPVMIDKARQRFKKEQLSIPAVRSPLEEMLMR